MDTPKNDYEALVLALTLAIGMPDEDKASSALETAEMLMGNLSELEVERAKKQALKNLDMES